MENFCVICGCMIPEGLMVCPKCEKRVLEQSHPHLKNNTKERKENGNQTDESVSKVRR